MTTVNTTSGSGSLNAISNSYQSEEKETDPLGLDAFLTMLVAQLENQDPLNPMENSDFSAQLAQFSQLEQAMYTNDHLEAMLKSMDSGSETRLEEYIGQEIMASVDTIDVSGGLAVGGYYTLDETAIVQVKVFDAQGNEVRNIYPGVNESGSHQINWDGMDDTGNLVDDGTYKFTVYADSGNGFKQVDTTIQGVVDSVIYDGDSSYLQVGGTFVSRDSILKVWEPADAGVVTDPMDYMGRTVEATSGIIGLSGGDAPEVGFALDAADDVKVAIYDFAGNLVRVQSLGEMDAGEGSFRWDGKGEDGITAASGVYSYQVLTQRAYADTTVAGEVDGIVYHNGTGFLQVGDQLVYPPDIVKIHEE
jgi:flagellar basal-body rod modification protein FlgD